MNLRLLTSLLLAMVSTLAAAEDPYEDEILAWRIARMEALKKPTGYLNLVGLLRLNEGTQSFGHAESDDLRLDASNANGVGTIGHFSMSFERVQFTAADGVEVLIDGEPLSATVNLDPAASPPSVLSTRSLRWFVIKRGTQTLVRVRDLETPRIREFPDFEYYPIDPAWRFEATFVPFSEPTSFTVPNVIGENEVVKSTGTLNFTHAGKTYVLDAGDEGDVLFVNFGDATNGTETYGAGRFVYVDKPVDGTTTILDLNKSYNPPCSFSKYTTCPLPTKGNILPMAIRVGEKAYRGAH